MKFSIAVACALAPLSLAARVRNYPVRRDGHLKEAEKDKAIEQGYHGWGFDEGAKKEVIIIWANPGNAHETTTYNEKVTVTHTVTVAPDAAHPTTVPGKEGDHTVMPGETTHIVEEPATHTVIVGGPGGLIFQPDSLSGVPVGDTVIFEFQSQNHTVTQSPFDTPCKAMEGGMDSGFQPNKDNTVSPAPQVAMQVMDTKPLWFYCKQGNHCGQGMVFSINPTAEKTQADFKALAIAQNGDGKETPITGGEPPADKPADPAPPADKPADAPPAEAPPADKPADAPPAEGDKNATPGKGVVQDGECLCMVSCSASGFPAADVQGLNANGGMGGSLPINNIAAAK